MVDEGSFWMQEWEKETTSPDIWWHMANKTWVCSNYQADWQSNDDTRGIEMTIYIVYHLTTSQKECWSKILVKGTTLGLIKKTIPIVLDLLKST